MSNFGYHDSDNCAFDLWSPVDADHALENRAFSAYAKHNQEREDIVNEIINQYYQGNMSFTLDVDDDFSDADLMYIRSAVMDKIGVPIF